MIYPALSSGAMQKKRKKNKLIDWKKKRERVDIDNVCTHFIYLILLMISFFLSFPYVWTHRDKDKLELEIRVLERERVVKMSWCANSSAKTAIDVHVDYLLFFFSFYLLLSFSLFLLVCFFCETEILKDWDIERQRDEVTKRLQLLSFNLSTNLQIGYNLKVFSS
jgi:hypothetical protein